MAEETPNINQILSSDFEGYLQGTRELNSIEDPITSILIQFKKERFEPVERSEKEKVWAILEKQIQTPAKIYKIEKKSYYRTWAVAATVLIASFIGLYFVFMNQSPEVILETYAQVDKITLEDGTEVTLRPYSKLVELNYSSMAQSYQIEGEAYFNVAKKAERKFSVTAGSGEVIVLGTQFNLSNWGDDTQVYLEEGSLRFINVNTESAVILEPGESARTLGRLAVTLDENVNADEFNDWRSNQLVFDNRELAIIITELEQHFNIKIRIPDELQTVRLSGGLTLQSPEQSLEYLSLTLDGAFEKISMQEYRFIPLTE